MPVYEAGESDGHLYIAMRYVEGTDLASLLRLEGAMDPQRAVDLVGQLGHALDAAHGRGLAHREVKPSNALVAMEGADEHVYLADFGLTKHIATVGATATDQLVGTVDYVAPERIAGEPADGRADLYSLGCVLFELLTVKAEARRAPDTSSSGLGAKDQRQSERHIGRLPPAVAYRQRESTRVPCPAASRRGVLLSSACLAVPADGRAASAASARARGSSR